MPISTKHQLRKVHAVVDQRDGDSCRRCGHPTFDDFSRHHRIPRGAGGSTLVDRPSNILKLCGSGSTGCHGWVESHRADAEVLGYLLPKLNKDIDPATEPVFVHEFGWVLLDDHGTVTPCASPRRDVT